MVRFPDQYEALEAVIYESAYSHAQQADRERWCACIEGVHCELRICFDEMREVRARLLGVTRDGMLVEWIQVERLRDGSVEVTTSTKTATLDRLVAYTMEET